MIKLTAALLAFAVLSFPRAANAGSTSPIIYSGGCAFNLITKACIPTVSGGTVNWGNVLGTLGNQADLVAALAAKQASIGYTPANVASNLSDLLSASTARTNLGLGTAATQATSFFEPAITGSTTAKYFRGDKTFQTLDTSVVPENGNLYFTAGRAQAAVSASSPLVDTAGVFSIPVATNLIDGYLSHVDWVTFNTKQSALTPGNASTSTSGVTVVGTAATVGPAITVDVQTATNGQPGLLSAADHTSFAAKQAALTFGSVSTSTTGVTVGSGANSTVGPNVTVNVQTASGSQPGLLASADWNTFNSKEPAVSAGTTLQYYRGDKTFQTLNTTVVPEGSNLYFTNARAQGAVSASSPLVDTAGVFSIPVATTLIDGYLAHADWNTFNNKQSALTPGNASTSTAGVTVVGTAATVGPAITVDVQTATNSQPGLLSSADHTSFAAKEPAIAAGTTLQYWRGDKSFQTLDTSVVPENGSLYFTNARARGALSVDGGADPLAYNSGTGQFLMPAAATAQNGYLAQADWNTFNGKQPLLATNAGVAHQWFSSYAAGVFTGTQPGFPDISGTAASTQLPTLVADTASVAGTQGAVPAPASGTTRAGQFLTGNGFSYVDQSHPQYSGFPLLGQTADTVTNIKLGNIAIYTGIDGNKKYAAMTGGTSATLSLLDITDQSLPKLLFNNPVISGTTLTGALNISIATIAGHIYAFIPSNGASKVYIVDITDPLNPSLTSTFPVTGSPGSIYGGVYNAGYMYLATQSTGLVVLDVGGGASGGTLAVPVQSFQEGGGVKSFGVFVANGTVFTTQYITTVFGTRQIKSWNISTPQTPSLTQSLQVTTAGEALGITVSGNTAIVTVQGGGAFSYDLIDVTTPSAMTNLSQISFPSGYVQNSAFVGVASGNYLFLPWGSNSTFGGRVDFYDITTRTAPVFIANAVTGVASSVFGGISLDTTNGYIFAADYGVAPGTNGNLDVFVMPKLSSVHGNILASTITATTGVNYSPVTPANWSPSPAYMATALDQLATRVPVGGSVSTVTGTAPVVSSGGTTPAISMAQATTSVDGYLAHADWNTFNGKQAAITPGSISTSTTGVTVGSGSNSTVGPSVTVNVQNATTAQPGLLTSADWNTFNGKQNALTTGNLSDAGTDGITVTSGTGAVIGTGTSLSQHVADTTHNGFLNSTDWNTFNAKQTALAPGNISTSTTGVTVVGTAVTVGPAITVDVQTATNAQPGLLSAADHTSFAAKQSAITTGTTSQYFRGDLSLSTFATDAQSAISATAPVVDTAGVISMHVADTTHDGFLSHVDWNTFNSAAGGGITSITGDVTGTGPGATATTIAANAVTNAKAAQMATHTIKGNNTGSTANALDLTVAQVNTLLGTVTSVSGTAPVVSSGGATPAISMHVADTSDDGYLAQGDWNAFNGKQAAIGFTPENVANKSTDATLSANSDTLYASQKAVKAYIDATAANGVAKGASVLATTAALPANTYNNGASGVGATLTGVGFGALVVDGTTTSVGQRVLVKNEVTAANDGIYTVTTVGAVATLYVLTRATDFNSSADVVDGATTYITSGSTVFNTTWQLDVAGAVTVGTTALAFNQIAGPGAILAGTGLSISGSTISLSTPVVVANGGTNSSAALNNNRVMQSSGGAIVESAAITGNRALVSNASGIPIASSVTDTTLAFLDATSSVQTQLNSKQATISSSTAVSHQFLTAFTAPNTFVQAQPAFTDLTGSATNAQLPVMSVVAKTSTYTATASDRFITACGTFTITLPAATTALKNPLTIKSICAGTVTIAAGGGDLVEFAATISLTAQGQSTDLFDDGSTNWYAK